MAQILSARPSILLVGTGHWANPGKDYKSVEFDDMRSPHRQDQIAQVLDRLVHYRPTAIAIELMLKDMESTNEDYRNFRAGMFELTANERHQLGFRLAAKCDLEQLHGIDWHDHDRSIGWDSAISFAKDCGQFDLISFHTDLERETDAEKAAEQTRLRSMSVREQLITTNNLSAMRESHDIYLEMARIGSETSYIGADVITRWYERNMKMFVNIARLATAQDDRILVFVGGGHLPLLTHFIEGSSRFQLERIETFLN